MLHDGWMICKDMSPIATQLPVNTFAQQRINTASSLWSIPRLYSADEWGKPESQSNIGSLLSNGYTRLLSGVSTHTLPSNGHLIVAHSLLRDVFTGLLPSSGCPVVGCALVGMCLPILFLETAKSVTVYWLFRYRPGLWGVLARCLFSQSVCNVGVYRVIRVVLELCVFTNEGYEYSCCYSILMPFLNHI
jgi:hypothetical protein